MSAIDWYVTIALVVFAIELQLAFVWARRSNI